jgi:hypothetical protein
MSVILPLSVVAVLPLPLPLFPLLLLLLLVRPGSAPEVVPLALLLAWFVFFTLAAPDTLINQSSWANKWDLCGL